ncbi:MAG: hypothetical protein WCJ26_08085, partial [bacterium]
MKNIYRQFTTSKNMDSLQYSSKPAGNRFGLRMAGMALLFVLMMGAAADAATKTSVAGDGLWNTAASWSPSGVPAAGDAVIIATAIEIDVAVTQTSGGSVTVNSGGVLTTATTVLSHTFGALTINSGGTFTVYRQLTVLGAASITGTINFGSTSTSVRNMTFTGDVTLNSGANWNETSTQAAATFSFGGSFTNNATTFTALNTTHTFTGSGKTIGGATPNTIQTVIFSGSYTNTGTLTAATSVTVNNGATLQMGSGASPTTIGGGGTFTLSSGGTLGITSPAGITVSGATGNIQCSGTRTYSTGANYIYNGNASQAAGTGLTQNHPASVLINNSGNTVTLAAAVTITGNLSVQAGILDLGTGLSHTSLTLTLGGVVQTTNTTYGGTGSAASNINTTYFSASTGILGVDVCSTGTWLGTNSIDWNTATNWCNNTLPTSATDVSISSTATRQPTISGAAVCNNIAVNTGATLTISGSNTLTVSGNWTKTGTFTASTGTVVFNGTTQSIGAGPFNNLTLSTSGVKTLSGVTVNGILSMEGAATISGTPGYGAAATLQYKGSGAQTSGSEFPSTWSGTGGVINANTSGFAVTLGAAKTINSSFTVNTGAVLNLGTGLSHTCTTLSLGGVSQTAFGTTYGSNPGSSATVKNATYFGTTATGILTVGTPCSAGQWLGTTSTDWNTASNWCNNTLPTSATDVSISSTATTQPTISAGAVCRNITINSSATLTVANGGTLSIYGTATKSGTLTTSTGSTVEYAGGTQSVLSQNYYNLRITNSGTKTWSESSNTRTINGTLTVDASATLSFTGSRGRTVTGTTSVSGTLLLSITASTSMIYTFTGNVTISNGGTWNNTTANPFTIAGNFQNNGTFTASTGIYTFSGAGKTISGTNAITIPNATFLGTITNSAALTVSTALAGSGSLTNSGTLGISGTCSAITLSNSGTINRSGSGTTTTVLTNFTNTGTINISGSGAITGITNNAAGIVNLTSSGTITSFNNATSTSTFNIIGLTIPTISTLTTSTAGNTVNYSGAGAQAIKVNAYSNLTLSGSGAKTFQTGATTVNGTLSIEGTATATLTGTITYGASAILQYKGSAAQTTGGEFPASFTSGQVSEIRIENAYTTGVSLNGTKNIVARTFTIGNTVPNSVFTDAGNQLTGTGTLNLVSGKFVLGAGTATTLPAFATKNITAGTTVEYAATVAQTVKGLSNYSNLTISGGSTTIYKTADADVTVNGILTLGANPSAAPTFGCLSMSTFTLNMGASATTSGAGDVTGNVKRASFAAGTDYTFGNQYTTMNFASGGTLPTDITFKIAIGASPSWLSTAVKRNYDIIRTGGSGTTVTLSLHYLDAEIQANSESSLVLWDAQPSTPVELGKSNKDNTNNWIALSNLSITGFATAFANHYWGLANKSSLNFVWKGLTSSDWNVTTNWVDGVVPSSTSDVVIPDGATTNNDPVLPTSPAASVKSLTIDAGGILNGGTSTTLTVAGSTGAWANSGTFNAGTSTVLFTNANATMSDPTNFYNVTIANGASLTPQSGNTMRISGSLTLTGTGILNAAAAPNTIEYNGTAQSVLNPNGTPAGYSTLILSGSGTKTLPATALSVAGNFTLSGTTTATAGAAISFAGNVTLGSGTTFNGGSYTHNILGDWTNNGGTFSGGTSTINFNNTSSNQNILGSAATKTFNNLTVAKNGTSLVIGGSTTTLAVQSTLTMTSGNINCGAAILELGTSAPAEGTLNYTAGSIIGSFKRWLTSTGAKTFPIGTSGGSGTASANRDALLTFVNLTNGSLTANFTATDPGSNGLPLLDGGVNLDNQFTEGYWSLVAANSLASTDYNLELTGTGFTSYSMDGVHILKRANAGAWSNTGWGTYVNTTGATAKRTGLSGFSEFAFGKDLCNSLAVIPSVTQPSCWSENGSISLTVNGGNPLFTYDWADLGGTNNIKNRVGLAVGNYSVIVTDQNGCTASSGTIALVAATGCTGISVCQSDVAFALSVEPDPANTSYTWSVPSGATIASGQGTPAVTVNWTGLSAGTYFVSVTAANICGTSAATVHEIYVKAVTAAASADAVCSGGNLQLYANGGSTYAWSGPNGFTSQANNPLIYNVSALNTGAYTVTVTNSSGCTAAASVSLTVNAAPAISGVVTNTSCGNTVGAISLTVSGGSGFTYLWSPGETTKDISGLAADIYSVIVTNSTGCSAQKSFGVGNSNGPSATASVVNVSCNGGNNGSVTLSVSGGTSPYTFDWSNGGITQDISSLIAGVYSVVITDNSSTPCVSYASATITEPNPLQINPTLTHIRCNGASTGAIGINVAGGTGPYTYDWGGGVTDKDRTGLAAGTYSVTVTDNSYCSLAESFTLNQPAESLSATPVITGVSCFGGSNGQVVLTVTGGTEPYAYVWSGPGGSATTKDILNRAAGDYSVTVTDNNGCSATLATVTISQPAVLALSSLPTNINCKNGANGSIVLSVSGGTTAYSYSWSNGATTRDISSLVAGSYSVIVTDAHGCTASATQSVTEPDVLTASAGAHAVSCYQTASGSITLTVGGGTSAYSYSWSNGATTENLSNLTAGFYSVVVSDSKGCSAAANATVTEPNAIFVSASFTNVTCNGFNNGTIDVSAAGGTGTLHYLWADGPVAHNRTGLSAGSYSVTVTDDNTCSSVGDYTILEPSSIVLSMAETNVSCFGGSSGSIILDVSGGASPVTYLWSNGATVKDIYNLTTGTYTVTVTDANSCTSVLTSDAISSPALLSVSAVSTAITCYNGTNGSIALSVSGGITSYTYEWAGPSGYSANTKNISNLGAGTYSVLVSDANGCTSTVSASVTQPSAPVTIYAVTTKSSCGLNNGCIILTVQNGSMPYSYLWSNEATDQNLSGLSAGSYSVTVTDAGPCTQELTVTVSESPALSVAVTVYNKDCTIPANGAVYAVPDGGVPPYSYVWYDGSTAASLNGLSTGTYTVTVTEANGCTATGSGTITQPSCEQPVAADADYTTCFDTQIINGTVATAGQENLTFFNRTIPLPEEGYILWDPSDNGSFTYTPTPGYHGTFYVVYRVCASSGLCDDGTLTITVDNQIAHSEVVTNIRCHGGSEGAATLSLSGGTAPFSYSWSNGQTSNPATGLTAGSYSVTVSDADACSAIASVTVTQPSTPLSTEMIHADVSYHGGNDGSAAVNVSGGSGGYLYLWDTTPAETTNGVTGLYAGTYSVTITDASACTAVSSIQITQPESSLAVEINTYSNVKCFGSATGSATVTIISGNPGYSYLWNNGQTLETATGLSAGSYTVTVTDATNATATASVVLSAPEGLLAASASQTHYVTCSGGSEGEATVTPSLGWGGYTYLWNNSQTGETATGLTAGNYAVTVTDAHGCTATATAEISAPAGLLAASASQTHYVTCLGGSDGEATVTATLGWSGYTYLWSNNQTGETATGLTAGNYAVTVTDAHGCTATATAVVSAPAGLLAASASQTHYVTCLGGSDGEATVTATLGWGGYTYLWNNSQTTETATGLSAGTYTVTVTDAHGCTATATSVVSAPGGQLAASASQTHYVTCLGGSDGVATVTASLGWGGYTYLWNNSQTGETATGLTAGTYAVTVTDAHGCTATATAEISAPAGLLAASASQTHYVTCLGGSEGEATVTPSLGWGGYTYLWNNSQTSQTATGLTAGTYAVTVTDTHGCTATATAVVSAPGGQLAASASQTHYVTCLGGSEGEATVTATLGWGGYTYLWNNSQTSAIATGLTAGTYAVTVTDAHGCTATATAEISAPAGLLAASASQT